jgi:alkanesulfonate monooxygenase SsuD/methylene tetrahydromethanopterin reductase-like flavin-dependent oxidoreductase (luciferase family)
MELAIFNTLNRRDLGKPVSKILSEAMDHVRTAEDLGFDIAWFPEHHFSNYSICPNPTTMSSFAAARTSRIRVGPAVVVVPLHSPVRILEELAFLDQLSDGRAALGFGGGYQEFEFHRFGVKMSHGNKLYGEFLDMLEQYVDTGIIDYEGECNTVPRTEFTLRFQQPRPQVFLASGTATPEVQARIVARGYVPIMSMVSNSIDWVEERYNATRAAYAAAGGTAEQMPFAINQYIYVTKERALAEKAAAGVRYVTRVHGAMRGAHVDKGAALGESPFPGEPEIDALLDRVTIGDPETVLERLLEQRRRLNPTNMTFVMAVPGMMSEETLKSMELFGKEVMPAFRAFVSPASSQAAA